MAGLWPASVDNRLDADSPAASSQLGTGRMLAPPNKNEVAPTVRDSRGQMSARQVIVVYVVEIANALWFSVELKDSVIVKRHMKQQI
jgi:hypothetical protein